MTDEWPFDQGPDVAALTTRQVLQNGLPVLRVIHYYDDDSWAFVCGTTNKTEDLRIIAMSEALAADTTLRGIADLPPGWTAWRDSVGKAWHRNASDQEQA